MPDPHFHETLLDHCCKVFLNVSQGLKLSTRSVWQQELQDPMAAVLRTLAQELVSNLLKPEDDEYNKILFDIEKYILMKANEHLDDES
jgi:hypothetical protein